MNTWLQSVERNEVTYWIGLFLLFVGLSILVSIAMALVVVGGVVAAESVVTSYLAMWMASLARKK